MPADEPTGYFIWGADFQAYGPVELPELVGWIKDERVLAETWVYLERSCCWEKAEHVPELQMFFHQRSKASKGTGVGETTPDDTGLSPELLRHVKVLAGLNDEQLRRFASIMKVKTISAGAQLAKQGDRGDAMYLVVEGGLRLRAHADGRETTLGDIHAGEFLGEITLFDQGPRCADFIALGECTLLRVPAAEFEKFVYEAPDVAAPFLLALAKTLITRIRAEHHRYRDTISHVRPAGH